jgi:Ca2+/Na+ antiporter
MKLLPHYFKWIGIGLLILSFVFGIDDFLLGLYGGWHHDSSKEFKRILPEIFAQTSDYILLISLLIYLVSRNKREDEFIQKIRYESAYIVLVTTILIILVLYIIIPDINLKVSILLALQMLFYLVVMFLRKRIILGEDYEE